MLGASALPRRWRNVESDKPTEKPAWFNKSIAPALQAISSRACTHPIRSIVSVLVIASTVYVRLLDNNLFDSSPANSSIGQADFVALVDGSKHLHADQSTNWKWVAEDPKAIESSERPSIDLALLTLEFPASENFVPLSKSILSTSNSAKLLPSSSNAFSDMSGESTLAFSVPYVDAPEFLSSIQEIRAPKIAREPIEVEIGGPLEEKKWIMKAARPSQGSRGIRGRVVTAWSSFVDLLKNAESLDITIMALGYLSMHLTFVSLFLSMRRLGSNFWLATTVLFSSGFAFLLGLLVTIQLGVDINMILLSEGLPFLVVTVGFEKPIFLTKAVLAASLDLQRKAAPNAASQSTAPPTIHSAVMTAVQEQGYEIVRDYFMEICILAAGAVSGVQGGLRPFCFLAAWILFFDCVLLFTFYTSILTIKLEVNRIKRHVALRRALEDDGLSRSVAEKVASSSDWPRVDDSSKSEGFFSKATDSSVPKFKAIMVSGFLIIGAMNFVTHYFRGSGTAPGIPGFTSVTQPPMDPYKVARSGLDKILANAQAQKLSTAVTVLMPIKYELQYPSTYYALHDRNGSLSIPGISAPIYNGVGGQALGGLLRSLEDPALGKWILAALAMSMVLNGYLFNAARMTIKDPQPPVDPPRAEEIQDGAATPRTPTAGQNGHAGFPRPDLRMTTSSNGAVAGLLPVPTPRIVEEKSPLPPQRSNNLAKRPFAECEAILKEKRAPELNDEELIELSLKGKIPGYALEKTLVNKTRAVKIRRAVVSRTHATRQTSTRLEDSKLPYESYNYDLVHGACCENVIGYLPLPLGVAGPLMIDGQNYFLPMATTEGVLVASTSRGAKAINAGGGAVTVLTGDGMTRGPCVGFETLARAGAAKVWLDSEEGQKVMKAAFNSTSSFARLQSMTTSIAGTYVYIRFKTTTGDAMGMNMISKGVEKALDIMSTECGFDDMNIISLSGNYCTDKKPAAINWINGRGKSVVAEAIIPADVVKSVLKCDVDSLVELNISKNLIGSAMAGSIGGFNAHAANIVTAIFLATGQDPAQNVESSNCITVMKNYKGNLQISVSMPSIEVGTLGGGTILEPQSAMLDLLGVRGPHPTTPGDNSRQLARIIAAAVLAGELSLCGALSAGHLVRAHMSHNRSAVPSRAATPAPTSGTQTPITLAMSAARDQTAQRSVGTVAGPR